MTLSKIKNRKIRNTDELDTKGIFRLIKSVPSPKIKTMKLWLASPNKERIDKVFNQVVAGNRIINYYRNKDYTDE